MSEEFVYHDQYFLTFFLCFALFLLLDYSTHLIDLQLSIFPQYKLYGQRIFQKIDRGVKGMEAG